MQVAIISDIHGNAVALDTVLADIEEEDPDQIVCLGDVAQFGPEPIAALERIQQLGCPVVNGNTDEWLFTMEIPDEFDEKDKPQEVKDIGEWCADQLTQEHERFIKSFEDTVTIELSHGIHLLCYHGTPQSPWEILEVESSNEKLDQLIESTDADILIGGHIHNQMLRRYMNVSFVNAGSVGLPFGTSRQTREEVGGYQPKAEWVMVEASEGAISIDFRQTSFDVDAVIDTIRNSDMPHQEQVIDGWENDS